MEEIVECLAKMVKMQDQLLKVQDKTLEVLGNCYFCGKKGHFKKDSPDWLSSRGKNARGNVNEGETSPLTISKAATTEESPATEAQ